MLALSKLVTASALALASVASAKPCPPLGPVLPAPMAPSKHEAMPKAVKGLAAGLDEQTAAFNTSGISIAAKSLHEDKQLFSYHFTPPVTSGIGTKKIDENTIYRVGSVSKMMAALAALQNKDIDMEASVLEYIPELRNATGNQVYATPWEDVTVRALANHLSGIATDMATDLGVFPSDAWAAMGLPEIPKGERPSCSGLPPTEPCTKEDLIKNIGRLAPVFLPETSPSYSNTAYAILGMVVEAATGKKFNDAVKDSIYDVAGMSSSSFDGPVHSFSERGFVPQNEPTWNGTLGIFESAGGMFSNTVDMIAFAEAIQNNKLLSASKTREWMKPQTHTSSAYFSVGAPWEILRSDNITSDGRLIDVYTKTGDLGLYHAVIGIVPDYDISVSVLTGGLEVSATVSSMLLSAVIEATLPVVEAAGRDEASRFEGTYSDKSTNSTLVLTSDSSPGLVIKEFQVRGFDVLHNFDSYNVNSAEGAQEQPTRIPEVDGRLYPTKRQGRGSQNTEETAWRAVFDSTTEEDKEKVDSQLFYPDGSCTSWFSLDRSAYNYHSLADFVIVEGSEGDVKAVKNRAFNVTLTKVSDGNDDGDDDESDDGDNGGDGSESVPENPADMMRMMGNSAMFVVTMLILVHFL